MFWLLFSRVGSLLSENHGFAPKSNEEFWKNYFCLNLQLSLCINGQLNKTLFSIGGSKGSARNAGIHPSKFYQFHAVFSGKLSK